MKQRPWIGVFVLVLLGMAASARAQVQPERSRHCPRNPVGSYCWAAALVNGEPADACHSGDYDPCCDPDYQW